MKVRHTLQKLIPICIFSIIYISVGLAQDDVYYSHNATLQVNGAYENKPFRGQTKELIVSLDYETTEMIVKFQLDNLNFNVDTLNELLRSKHHEIIFSGELSLDYINTEGHPPLNFVVEGWLTTGSYEKTKVKGKGELHHLDDSGTYACMLGMTLSLNLKDLNIDFPAGLYEEVEVVITQALLEKDKN